MKVIKKEDISNWTYKYTCSNCDSELEVESGDLKYTRHDGDMREPGYDKYTANCAVCSNMFTILESKIPKLIKLAAKNKSSSSPRGGNSYFDR